MALLSEFAWALLKTELSASESYIPGSMVARHSSDETCDAIEFFICFPRRDCLKLRSCKVFYSMPKLRRIFSAIIYACDRGMPSGNWFCFLLWKALLSDGISFTPSSSAKKPSDCSQGSPMVNSAPVIALDLPWYKWSRSWIFWALALIAAV